MGRGRRLSVAAFGNRKATGDLPEKKICKKGIVFTFSHDEFSSFEPRPGREIDEYRINDHFSESLHYDVEKPFVNLTGEEVRSKAEEAAADEKLEDYDCVVVVVITQFDVIGKYLAKTGDYIEDNIIHPFKNCSSIVHKPKIFIFQASKATKQLFVTPRSGRNMEVDGNQAGVTYTLPVEANLFIVRSHLPHVTENNGTWFIDQVCNYLIGQLPLHDEMLNVLRSVNDQQITKLNESFASFLPDVSSTLIYKVFLSYDKVNSVDHKLEKYDRGKRNGCLFIFNYNKSFNEATHAYEHREGTENDVNKLKETFERLDFDVVVYNDLTKNELLDKLKSCASEEDEEEGKGRCFSSDMCIIVAVLTHGYDGKLGTTKGYLDPKDLFSMVDDQRDLIGKPKIFIFQACRGSEFSLGVHGTGTVEESATSNENLATNDDQLVADAGAISTNYNNYSTPSVPELNKDNPLLKIDDMIVLHGAIQGMKALRNVIHGSWLIQELCACVNRRTTNYNEASLTDIFTEVQREVSLRKWGVHKQMPVYTSTLTKRIIIGKRTTK